MATRLSARYLRSVVAAAAVVLGTAAGPRAAAGPPPAGADRAAFGGNAARLEVHPQRVPIDLFYGGATLQVDADVRAGRTYAVLLEGRREPLTVKRKGKVWSLLWMNVGEVTFADVPTVYLLQTNAPRGGPASAASLAAAGMGYDVLSRRAGADAAAFRELIRMKEKEGFYAVAPEAVELEPKGEGTAHLTASLPLTARIPPGDYAVSLIGFDGDHTQRLAETTVRLERTGLARSLHDLAMEHGLLYGCTAVLIAMLAGFGTGLIFGKGAMKGH